MRRDFMKRFRILTLAAALLIAGTAFSARRNNRRGGGNRGNLNNPRNYVYAQGHVEVEFLQQVANGCLRGGSFGELQQRLNSRGLQRLKRLLNIRNADGRNALHIAAKNKRPNLVRLLVNLTREAFPRQFDARVNVKIPSGNTALHLAAKNGAPAVVNVLLNQGARANVLNRNGETALHLGTRNNRPAAVRNLLNNRTRCTKPNLANNNGDTALHIAARRGRPNIAQILLNNRANFRARNNAGFTPLHVAQNNRKVGVVNKIQSFKFGLNGGGTRRRGNGRRR